MSGPYYDPERSRETLDLPLAPLWHYVLVKKWRSNLVLLSIWGLIMANIWLDTPGWLHVAGAVAAWGFVAFQWYSIMRFRARARERHKRRMQQLEALEVSRERHVRQWRLRADHSMKDRTP